MPFILLKEFGHKLKRRAVDYLLTHFGLLNIVSNQTQAFSALEYLSPDFLAVIKRNSNLMRWLKPAELNNAKLIRLGSKFDGGYVIPNDYGSCPLLISIGLGNNIDFERDFLSNPNKKVIGIDASIDKLQIERFTHIQSFVKGKKDLNSTSNLKSFESIFPLKSVPDNSILKVDCEGDELKILDDLNNKMLEKFRILIIEIHNIPKSLATDYQLFRRVMIKIYSQFQSIHIHANNGTPIFRFNEGVMFHTVEITFVQRKSYKFKEIDVFRAPKVLDSPTIKYLRDYEYYC